MIFNIEKEILEYNKEQEDCEFLEERTKVVVEFYIYSGANEAETIINNIVKEGLLAYSSDEEEYIVEYDIVESEPAEI